MAQMLLDGGMFQRSGGTNNLGTLDREMVWAYTEDHNAAFVLLFQEILEISIRV